MQRDGGEEGDGGAATEEEAATRLGCAPLRSPFHQDRRSGQIRKRARAEQNTIVSSSSRSCSTRAGGTVEEDCRETTQPATPIQRSTVPPRCIRRRWVRALMVSP